MQWVGQGAPKPVGKLAFTAVTLGITKCAGIIVDHRGTRADLDAVGGSHDPRAT